MTVFEKLKKNMFVYIKSKQMKVITLIVLLIIPVFVFAQESRTEIKIIPEFALKFGSQDPKVGIEGDLITGVILKNTYFLGLGGGYASDMGLGGAVYPLFIDGRIYFSPKNFLTHFGLSVQKETGMQVSAQTGITINTNDPYKTGLLLALSLGYRFDILKIKSKSILPFYSGLKLEYNRTGFNDEYRGYEITDGYISQMILHLYISLDFNSIKL